LKISDKNNTSLDKDQIFSMYDNMDDSKNSRLSDNSTKSSTDGDISENSEESLLFPRKKSISNDIISSNSENTLRKTYRRRHLSSKQKTLELIQQKFKTMYDDEVTPFYINPEIDTRSMPSKEEILIDEEDDESSPDESFSEPNGTSEDDDILNSEGEFDPLRSSLTVSNFPRVVIGAPGSPSEDFDPYFMDDSYSPPGVGPEYQCQDIPELLSDTEKCITEKIYRSTEPQLVFQPYPEKTDSSSKL